MEYTKDELSAVMAAVSRGNEQTGGAEVVARGSGVVTFVQLSTTREEVRGVSLSVPLRLRVSVLYLCVSVCLHVLCACACVRARVCRRVCVDAFARTSVPAPGSLLAGRPSLRGAVGSQRGDSASRGAAPQSHGDDEAAELLQLRQRRAGGDGVRAGR